MCKGTYVGFHASLIRDGAPIHRGQHEALNRAAFLQGSSSASTSDTAFELLSDVTRKVVPKTVVASFRGSYQYTLDPRAHRASRKGIPQRQLPESLVGSPTPSPPSIRRASGTSSDDDAAAPSRKTVRPTRWSMSETASTGRDRGRRHLRHVTRRVALVSGGGLGGRCSRRSGGAGDRGGLGPSGAA